VPALLAPGAGGEASLDAFPAPLGSSPALFNPPGLAGPGGTPLMPEVPAPAEPAPGEPAPALGEPAALPLPADDAPPPLCANAATGDIRIAIAAIAETIFMETSFRNQRQRPALVPGRNNFRDQSLHEHLLDGWS
jgi:hypothetical protein